MEIIRKDLRHAIRLFLNRPAFTFIALLTIALGIGINTAIFSIVNGVLLRPLPFPNADRLAAIFTVVRGADLDIFSPTNFLDVKEQNTSFDAVAVFTTLAFDLSTGGMEPQSVPSAKVSSDFFRVLGVQPALGRMFTAKDDVPGNDRVVILSHALWEERFSSDPQIIGQTININSTPSTIIGILPEAMEYPENVRIWAPIAFTEVEKSYRGSIYLEMIGRLKPGIQLEAAKQELKTIARRLEQDFPQTNRGLGMTALPLMEALVGDIRLALFVLAAAVAFVLLIACANLANLLVASVSTRMREFAVRSALGASRSRLLRQLITEALLLSVTGGLLGALFAFWSLPVLRALSPDQLPRIQEITMDWRVLFFTLLISILTGLLFGLAPAFGFSRPDLQNSLKEGTRGAGFGPQSKRLGGILIVLEVGLVLVLLTGAGLMVRSFSKLISVNPGFDPKNLISFQLTLPEARYREREHRLAFTDQLIEKLKGNRGTESVSIVQPSPFSGAPEVHDVRFRIVGRPEPDPANYPVADLTRISPQYFQTMGIPIIRGRSFTEQDRGEESVRVMIISQALAKSFFKNEDALGQKISLGRSPEAPVFEIVGIAADIQHLTLNAAIRPEVYIAFFQMPSPNFAVMTKTNQSDEFLSSVKGHVASLDPYLAVRFLSPLQNHIRRTTAPARANMVLLATFAGLALLLAVIGLYGLIAYSASQRTREIGIRVALGAQRQSILGLILRRGMTLTMMGALIGLFASLALSRFLRSLLFQVSPTDVSVFIGVSLLLLVTAFIACYIPARRASKLDPIVALRYE